MTTEWIDRSKDSNGQMQWNMHTFERRLQTPQKVPFCLLTVQKYWVKNPFWGIATNFHLCLLGIVQEKYDQKTMSYYLNNRTLCVTVVQNDHDNELIVIFMHHQLIVLAMDVFWERKSLPTSLQCRFLLHFLYVAVQVMLEMSMETADGINCTVSVCSTVASSWGSVRYIFTWICLYFRLPARTQTDTLKLELTFINLKANLSVARN